MPGLRILHVNRNPRSHLVVEHFLRGRAVAVVACYDPGAVVAAIRATHADLVLLDAHLPGSASHDALAAIRADDELAELPVAWMSAALDTTRAALDDPCTVVLAKPVRITDLHDLVRFHQRRLAPTPVAAGSG